MRRGRITKTQRIYFAEHTDLENQRISKNISAVFTRVITMPSGITSRATPALLNFAGKMGMPGKSFAISSTGPCHAYNFRMPTRALISKSFLDGSYAFYRDCDDNPFPRCRGALRLRAASCPWAGVGRGGGGACGRDRGSRRSRGRHGMGATGPFPPRHGAARLRIRAGHGPHARSPVPERDRRAGPLDLP